MIAFNTCKLFCILCIQLLHVHCQYFRLGGGGGGGDEKTKMIPKNKNQ